MRILVYGAGVLGSYLSHALLKAGKDVTLLARGSRYDELHRNGLVIRHVMQMRTTRDRIKLIQDLSPEDRYDIIFVVMQYTQLTDVLPVLAKNHSKLFVLIGNNAAPDKMKAVICSNSTNKTVLFGFQGTGGRRENGKVISIHAGTRMSVGTIDGEDFTCQKELLDQIFAGTSYKLNYRNDMKAYLLSHIAFILPIAYACYATNGDLKKADKALLYQIMEATTEGYDVLKANQISIPAEDEDYVRNKQSSYYRLLWVMSKTFIGKLVASDHAMHAVHEMMSLSDAFDLLKEHAAVSTPVWDEMEKYIKRWNRR